MTDFADQFKHGLDAQHEAILNIDLDNAQRGYAEAALTLHKAQQALDQWHNRENA